MKQRILVMLLAGLGLAGCEYMPGAAPAPAPVDPARSAAFVAVLEQSGCRFDPVSHEALHAAGFSDADMQAIGSSLVASGQAELAPDGGLILTTGTCV